MIEIYNYINKLDSKRLFLYITIIIFSLWLFSRLNLQQNILIGMVVLYFVLGYCYTNDTFDVDSKITSDKNKVITPALKYSNDHKDIVNFLFSIQDFRRYNPVQYDNFILDIDYFFRMYRLYAQSNQNNIYIDRSTDNIYIGYEVMTNLKRRILNDLHSLIFSIPYDRQVIATLNNSIKKIDITLTNYLDQISFIVDKYRNTNGYNVNTKITDYFIKPANLYTDIFSPYNFEIF